MAPPQTLVLGKGKNAFRWIDFEAPSAEQIDELGREHQFHPLTIEDAKTFDQRAKVQNYRDYLFLSLHTLSQEADGLHDYEMEVFLGRDYLISIHREPLALLARVRSRFATDSAQIDLGPDYLLYVIIDEMVTAVFPILDAADDEIDRLEDETIERASPQTLQRIFRLKQELIDMRRSVGPMRDVTNALAGTRFGFVDEQSALYFRDAYDHLARIHEMIETERDLLGSTLDTYLSVVSNRLNEVMKRLTLIATVFLPISFLVGLGGINFPQFPFKSDAIFLGLLASLVLVPAVMLLYFWRRGWF